MAEPSEGTGARVGVGEGDGLASTVLGPARQPPTRPREGPATESGEASWDVPRPAQELGDPRLKELILSQLFAGEATPPRIGRFTLLRHLGEGGMGVVYAAYDEHLDRKVAIKVLRTDSAPRRELLRARLLREAKLMAQLSHPNVITVHEAGAHEGQIFIAMEFVRGDSLDAWLRRTARERSGPHGWRRVIAVFVQAGAGLVAAHQAGLVHRDFKPQNVMVSETGAVKVLDFGLAREVPPDPTRSSSEERRERELPPLAAASLTMTGTVMGTPAYMAPEQHLGGVADERSDQFSFCVALYEALYGQHPFGGTNVATLRAAVLAGRVNEPPSNSPVPVRIRRLLVRGMAVRPEDRHPSLAALLQALTHDPAAVHRRWLAVGGLVLAASAGTYVLASRDAEAQAPCSGVEAELAEVWNPDRQAEIARAIRATRLPYAEDTWRRVERAIGAYTTAWTEMRARSCQVHHDALQSDRLYDLQTACLVRRRTAVDTLVSLLAAATPADVEKATQAVSALPSLAPCGDTEALAAALPPPDDPAVARAVEEHRATLARAREYEVLGRYDQARVLVEPVIAAPEAAAYTPLAAEALLALGAVDLAATRYEAATETLSRALVAGLRAGHLDVAAEAFARRIFTQGQTGDTNEALRDLPQAQALVDRSQDDQLRWLLLNNVGNLYLRSGRYDEARQQLLAALVIKEQAGDEEHVEYAVTLKMLGSVAAVSGDPQGARDYQVRALEVAVRALGPEHPEVARMNLNLARTDHYIGRFDAAHARMSEAVAAIAGAYGPDAESLVHGYLSLAELSNDRGDFAATLGFIERAGAVGAVRERQDHPLALYLFIHRAVALAELGRQEEAGAELRRGLALADRRLNPMHDPSELHDADGRVALGRGDAQEAVRAYRRALALREERPGTPAGLLAQAESRVAAALRAAGELDAAHELADRALARFLGSPQRQFFLVLAEIRLGLAEILLDLGRADEALAQCETARRELAATSEPHNPTLARLEFVIARALRRPGRSAADQQRAEALARGALASLRRHAPGFRRDAEAVERFLRQEFENSSTRAN